MLQISGNQVSLAIKFNLAAGTVSFGEVIGDSNNIEPNQTTHDVLDVPEITWETDGGSAKIYFTFEDGVNQIITREVDIDDPEYDLAVSKISGISTLFEVISEAPPVNTASKCVFLVNPMRIGDQVTYQAKVILLPRKKKGVMIKPPRVLR